MSKSITVSGWRLLEDGETLCSWDQMFLYGEWRKIHATSVGHTTTRSTSSPGFDMIPSRKRHLKFNRSPTANPKWFAHTPHTRLRILSILFKKNSLTSRKIQPH